MSSPDILLPFNETFGLQKRKFIDNLCQLTDLTIIFLERLAVPTNFI